MTVAGGARPDPHPLAPSPVPSLPPLTGRGGKGHFNASVFLPLLPVWVGGRGREKRAGVMRAYRAATALPTARAITSPTCDVVSDPPRSGVVCPSRKERATASSITLAASAWPR